MSTSILSPLSPASPCPTVPSRLRFLTFVVLLVLVAPTAETQEPRAGAPTEGQRGDARGADGPEMMLTDPVVSRDDDAATSAIDAPPGLAPRPRRQQAPPPIRSLRTGGLRAEVAALIMSGQSGGKLPLEVLVYPLQMKDVKARTPLSMEVPWRDLLAEHQEDPLRLEIFAYALTPGGGLRSSLMQTFEIDTQRLSDAQLAKGGLRFSGEMALEPGAYSLRVMARNPVTGDLGLRILDLEIPADGTFLSPMLVRAPESDWQALHQAYERGKAPPTLSGLEESPEAKPVLVGQTTTSFRILGSQLSAVPSRLTVEAVDRSGAVLGEIEAVIDGLGKASADGIRELTGHFQTRLGPGQHLLRARLEGDLGERLSTPPLPVVVVPSEPEGAISWAKLKANPLRPEADLDGEATAMGADDRTAERRQKRISVAPMRAAYREVLQILGEGDERRASNQLLSLEDGQLQQGFDHLETLRSVQLEMANRIAKMDLDALAPVMLMHHQQYRRMRQLRSPLLSTHARTLTLQLIEVFLQRLETPEAKRQVVSLMASLGSEAQRAGMVKLSENLLRRVLSLDASNETALLSLGFSAERTGDYDAAVDYYGQLVEVYPEHGQARVRLAVNLLRQKKMRPARRHLEAVIAGEHSPWILSLAYQELAKLYLEDNELEQAATLLARATERIPNDEKLYLQQAFVLDASQRTAEADEVFQTMELKARRNRDTSRHRYTEWPSEALAETRQFLDVSLRGQTPALETVLASSEFNTAEAPR